MITAKILQQIANRGKEEDFEKFIKPLETTFLKYSISTKSRKAMFLAQTMHESGGFRWLKEIWGPTPAQKKYEGRKDLGNIYPGDGKRYQGRGIIQITGRNNYKAFSETLYGKGDETFLYQPELLETPEYAVLSAGWFWDSRKLNVLADRGDILTVTKRINGGFTGLSSRKEYYQRALKYI